MKYLIPLLLLGGCSTVTFNGVRVEPTAQAALLAIGATAVVILADHDEPKENVLHIPEDRCSVCTVDVEHPQ